MMAERRGLLQRGYHLAALLALLNTLALGAVATWLAASGAVDRQKIQAVADVLRGASGAQRQPAAPEAAVSGAPLKGSDASRPTAPAPSEAEMEIAYRESERVKTEIDQRLALANAIMLKVTTEREAFAKEREAAAKKEQAALAKLAEEGFQKQISIMESLPPKLALEHLFGLNDPNEAAKMLMAMDTSRAKKIVEAAKKGEDLARMKIILHRLEEAGGRGPSELRAEAGGLEP